MNSIENYKILISNLPVKEHSVTTKSSTWENAEKKFDCRCRPDLSYKNIFGNQKSLKISRKDIFDTNTTKEVILKSIYWGYERGNRFHYEKMLNSFPLPENTFAEVKSKKNISESEFVELLKKLKKTGFGLSTCTKLLYFLNIKFNGKPCLILDTQLIDVFNSDEYKEYSSLPKIKDSDKDSDKAKLYFRYLDETNKLSDKLNIPGENIEYFLFTFRKNLKR